MLSIARRSFSKHMKAIIPASLEAEDLHVAEVPLPEVRSSDQVMLRIEATAVNRADILQVIN